MKKVSIILLIIMVPLIVFFVYMGGTSDIKVVKGSSESRELIFETHLGSYQGLKKSWEDFVVKFKKAGLKKCYSMGVYLDPPGTPEEKLRSILACDVTDLSIELKSNLRDSFRFAKLPKAKGFKSQFPFKNELSFMFAAIFVYPEFQILIESGELEPSVAIETYGYDEDRSIIQFFMPHKEPQSSYDAFYKAF